MKSRSFFIVATILGILALSGPSHAGTDLNSGLRHAQAALAAGDYDKAFAEYRRFADQGNPLAQFTMAMFHQLGWGRAVDPATACRWHEKAAGKIPASAHYLAECLIAGTHRRADPAKAAVWYERAAQSGHFSSLCALGKLHVLGKGVAKDPAKGQALCQRAARKGHVASMLRLGRFHLEGVAGEKDYAAALSWFEQAAQRKSVEAPYLIGVMMRDGMGGNKRPEAARGSFELAASRGHVPAYFATGALYLDAPSKPQTHAPTAKDLAKAYMWLSAARARSTDAGELTEARRLLARIGEIMPKTWVPALDAKVAEHLAMFPAR